MVLSITSSALTQSAQKIDKIRYFSIELQCVAMLPNTQYDFYVDGIIKNDFCRPFGKNLGDPLIADDTGKLLVQYHMGVPFNQKYLTNKVDESGYMSKTQKLEFRDPNGTSSISYMPMRVRAST